MACKEIEKGYTVSALLLTFSSMSFANNRNSGIVVSQGLKTVDYLNLMNKIVPYSEIVDLIGKTIPAESPLGGRPRTDLLLLIKMTLLQQRYGLSDEGVEENIYDRYSFQMFCDINIGDQKIPDATTVCRFRKHCTEHGLFEKIFNLINKILEKKGMINKQGTIVDATIITASGSTKNKNKSRDPEMHSTKKGSNYYFGAKAHIAVDQKSGLATAMAFTSANVYDGNMTDELLNGEEERIYGDSAYYSDDKKNKFEKKGVSFNVNKKGNLTKKDEFYNRVLAK